MRRIFTLSSLLLLFQLSFSQGVIKDKLSDPSINFKVELYKYESRGVYTYMGVQAPSDGIVSFTDLPYNNYTLKAIPANSSYWPTYFGSQKLLSKADTLGAGTGNFVYTMTLFANQPLVGNGTISGSLGNGPSAQRVDQSNQRTEASLAGVQVVLMNQTSNSPVAFTYTDAGGRYSFQNIPFGRYQIVAEHLALETTLSPQVSISQTAPTSTGNTLGVEGIVVTSTSQSFENSGMSIIQNNLSGTIEVVRNNGEMKEVRVILQNLLGNLISEVSSAGNAIIDTRPLPQGIYVLNVVSGSNEIFTKKIFITK